MTPQRRDPWARLGEQLREHRIRAKMSGRALGASIKCDQSRISRIESGKSHVTKQEAQRWLESTGASNELTTRFIEEVDAARRKSAEDLEAGLNGWRADPADIGAIELEAALVLTRQISFIPELLQSAAYMRHLLQVSTRQPRQRVASQIAARIERQKILYTRRRRLEVVLHEGLLRHRFGGTYIMLDQLDRISSLAKREAVDLSILPDGIEIDLEYDADVTIYLSPNEAADDLVISSNERRPVEDQAVTQQYIEQFRSYQRRSLRGAQAIEFVEGVAAEMAGSPPGLDQSYGRP